MQKPKSTPRAKRRESLFTTIPASRQNHRLPLSPGGADSELVPVRLTLSYDLRKTFHIACLQHDLRVAEALRMLMRVFVAHQDTILSLAEQLEIES
jgi:hypothetical protein